MLSWRNKKNISTFELKKKKRKKKSIFSSAMPYLVGGEGRMPSCWNFKRVGTAVCFWQEGSCLRSELKVGLLFLISVHPLIMPYICPKFHEEILNGFKVKELTQPHYMKSTKGHSYVRTERRVTVHFSAHCLIIHYVCAKFEILYGFKVIEQTENIAIWTLTLTFIGQDWFMNSAHCLRLANIWGKFRKHPSIYERDMQQTQKVNGQADNVKT